MTIRKGAYFLISWLALAIVAAGCGGGANKGTDKDKDKDKAGKAGDTAPLKADFTTTSEAIAKEFLAQPKEAEAKYKDKVLEITGPVNNLVSKDVVNLVGAKKDAKDFLGSSVNAGLRPAFHDKIGTLGKGQKVKVTGKFQMSFAGVIQLYDCTLEELEKSKILTFTSEALAKEFSADAKAAQEKYRDEDVVITGPVEDLVTKGDFSYAKLKGDGNLNVSVTLASDELPRLSKGKTAVLRGNFSGAFVEGKDIGVQMGMVLESK